MALKSTVFKAELQVNDLDRHYYHLHALTIARHPSETDERMMVRLLAFALHAEEALSFGNGLSTNDEPDLWHKDLTGEILLWIDVGLPEAKLLKKACGRSRRVAVYSYGRGADMWWNQNRADLERLDNLAVYRLPASTSQELAKMATRNMRLQCTIQDGEAGFTTDDAAVQVERVVLKAGTPGTPAGYR